MPLETHSLSIRSWCKHRANLVTTGYTEKSCNTETPLPEEFPGNPPKQTGQDQGCGREWAATARLSTAQFHPIRHKTSHSTPEDQTRA